MRSFLFSNFQPLSKPIVDNLGLSYSTIENYFQAQKIDEGGYQATMRRGLFTNCTPMHAKKIGNKVALRLDWNKARLDVMEIGLLHKYFRCLEHRKTLRDSKGPITEWNEWHDNFWGSCVCTECRERPKHNYMGLLLERVRDELQNEGLRLVDENIYRDLGGKG